jgi:hypothetical protein
VTESDNIPPQLPNDHGKSLNPHRPDKELGNLGTRFSEDTGRFATDEEVCRLNSRLVIKDPKNAAEHVLHCGCSELYLADRLRDLDHSFKNTTDLPNVQANPLRTTHYPQGRDDFTNNLSVIRPNGKPYQMYLSKLKVSVLLLIKFVIENGDSNVARDGNLNISDNADGDSARDPKATEPIQRRQVIFGCCGKVYSDECVNGHCAPNSTYDFGVFNKVKDEEEREMIKMMVGDIFDCMQECEDYIEMFELDNLLPFYHKGRDKRFAEQVRLLLNCRKTHQEDFTIQLKNIMQGERMWKHKDQWNCTWNGYTKTLTLSFTWVDALGEIWSIKFIANSCFKAGNFLGKVYRLSSMLTRMNLSMEKLNQDLKEVMLLQGQNGGHRYPNGLTSKTFHNLVLEELSPWIKKDIGNGVMQKLMRFTAGPVRDIHLSAPATIVHRYHEKCQDVRKSV